MRWAIRHVPSLIAGFDVLAGDQRQQPDGVGCSLVELDAVEGGEDARGVVDQPGDQLLTGGVVVPGDTGLPGSS